MKNKDFIKFILLILFSTIFLPSSAAESFTPKPASASLYNLGLKSYDIGDLQSAITFFQRAVDLDPEFVDAYFNLGAIYKKQKNYPQAINAFRKNIELSPKDYEAIFEIASCYYESKDYLKAREYFLSIPPTSEKYTEAKVFLDNINQTAFKPEGAITQNTSPEFQAKALIDALTNNSQEQNTVSEGFTQNQNSQTNKNPVHSITSPEELFKNKVQTVSQGLAGPTGIAKDSNGNIYVANFSTNTIEKIYPDGKKEIFIEKVGLNGPVGLALDNFDNLYVANYNNGSIIKVTQNKDVSIIANNLIKPYYLFYDSSLKKLFATVQGNNSIVEIETNTISNPITSR